MILNPWHAPFSKHNANTEIGFAQAPRIACRRQSEEQNRAPPIETVELTRAESREQRAQHTAHGKQHMVHSTQDTAFKGGEFY